MPDYIFGYGSLLNPSSAARTMQRQLHESELRLVMLDGYRRTWGYVTDTHFVGDPDGTTTPTVFLDVAEDAATGCNGLLLALSADELDRMDRRERGYRRVEVTGNLRESIDGRAWIYMADQGFQPADRPGQQLIIATRYVGIVEEALQLWGAQARSVYEDSTDPVAFPLRDGEYGFAHPDQEKAARRHGE